MSLTSGVKLHIHLLNVVVRFIVFLTSATLMFRGMDISKCFKESLGVRDNGSRLYLNVVPCSYVCSVLSSFVITLLAKEIPCLAIFCFSYILCY